MIKLYVANIAWILFFCSLSASKLFSQIIYSERIKGIRVEGNAEAKFPVVLLEAQPLTIYFDVDNAYPENFFVKLVHCDRDWNVTRSAFINDEFRNYSRTQIPYEKAPIGVLNYSWTYSLRIPNPSPSAVPGMIDFASLKYSGNYKFEIWDNNKKELLGEGKFFAAERISDSGIAIYNRYLPSENSPINQVNKLTLSFNILELSKNNDLPLIPNLIKTVYIFKNRQIELPHKIEIEDDNPNTYIEGWGTRKLKFVIDNLLPGNSYRRLDISSIDFYPPNKILKRRDGVDLSRWMQIGSDDYNGSSTLIHGNRYADYVQFQFELVRPEENTNDVIYVVGDFNNWKIDEKWRLKYNPNNKHYELLASLRRGAYDYQYVFNGNDWIALEGNDWRTKNVYTALLYYHDTSLGGYDRILLATQKKSLGGIKPTSY